MGAYCWRRKRSLLWRGGIGLDQAEVGTQSPSLASWDHVGTDFSPLSIDCPKVWSSHLQLISSPFAFMVLYFPPPESCYILLVYYLFGKSLFTYSYKPPWPKNILAPNSRDLVKYPYYNNCRTSASCRQGKKYCLQTTKPSFIRIIPINLQAVMSRQM